MTDVMHLVSKYGLTKVLPDNRKPYVGRTQYTRTWYWRCDRCTRQEIMSGFTHAEVLAAALVHAWSWPHYYARYSAQPA